MFRKYKFLILIAILFPSVVFAGFTDFDGIRVNGVPIFGTSSERLIVGNVFFVDSSTGSDTGPYGGSTETPFATIDYAIGRCTADNGDVIIVMPGHAETLTSVITADVAGITILGVGNELSRPTLTPSTYGISVTADDVEINGFVFAANASATYTPAKVAISGGNCTVRNCIVSAGAYDLSPITLDGDADYAKIVGNKFIVTADGPDCAVYISASGCDGAIVQNNIFDGGSLTNTWDYGAIYGTSVSPTSGIFAPNEYVHGGGISLGTTTGTGTDAGAMIAGPVQEYAVKTGPVALYGGTVADIFTIKGGPIAITALIAEAYSAVSANACTVQFVADPTTGADTLMCTTVDVNAMAAGSYIYIDGTIGNAGVIAVPGTALPLGIGMDIPLLAPAGTIDFSMANSNPTSGGAYFYMKYTPLVPGVTVEGKQ